MGVDVGLGVGVGLGCCSGVGLRGLRDLRGLRGLTRLTWPTWLTWTYEAYMAYEAYVDLRGPTTMLGVMPCPLQCITKPSVHVPLLSDPCDWWRLWAIRAFGCDGEGCTSKGWGRRLCDDPMVVKGLDRIGKDVSNTY